MKDYLKKENILHYLQYGPMDFSFKQMMFYWLIFDLPVLIILTLLLKVIL